MPDYPMFRRRWLQLVVLAAIALFSHTAVAGSYLDRVELLVTRAAEDSEFLRARATDKELAKVIHQLAGARLHAAEKMQIPPEAVQAHPHLLLVLEAHERAAEAAVRRDNSRFLVLLNKAWDEERILRGVLKELGFPIPERRPRGQ
jgi:hypothetical protein